MRSFSVASLVASLTVVPSAFAWESVRGNGEISTETRKIGEFSEIEVSGGMKVEVKSGSPSLTIETDKNLLEYLRTEVKGNRLIIRPKDNTSLRASKVIKVVVNSGPLTAVSVSGGIEMELGVMLVKAAKIEVSGGVNLKAEKIDADSLEVDGSGGVDMKLAGQAKVADIDLSGGVKMHAKGLATKVMKIDASGGCELEVAVAEAVKGGISGGVALEIYGAPRVNVSKSGGASVHVRE